MYTSSSVHTRFRGHTSSAVAHSAARNLDFLIFFFFGDACLLQLLYIFTHTVVRKRIHDNNIQRYYDILQSAAVVMYIHTPIFMWDCPFSLSFSCNTPIIPILQRSRTHTHPSPTICAEASSERTRVTTSPCH